jgi:hypothetical protein
MGEVFDRIHAEHKERRARLFPPMAPRIKHGWPTRMIAFNDHGKAAPLEPPPFEFKTVRKVCRTRKIEIVEEEPVKQTVTVRRLNFGLERIVQAVSQEFEIPDFRIRSRTRDSKVVLARSVIFWLARELLTPRDPLRWSGVQICRMLGNRDHSVGVHAVMKINRLLYLDPNLALVVAHLEARLSGQNEMLFSVVSPCVPVADHAGTALG